MHKIGVISDTHGLLRPEVVIVLRDCEVILHGGDFATEDILDELNQIAPVYAVRGNNDFWAYTEKRVSRSGTKSNYLPETLAVNLFGINFFMVHDKMDLPEDCTDYDIIIYGHSHQYEEIHLGRQLRLNPGSCGPKRFTLPITMAILEIGEDGAFHVKRVDLPGQTGTGKKNLKGYKNLLRKVNPSYDMKHVIKLVMKETQKGVPVEKIADKHGITLELAEQICRLYLTHPGVDADGIMKKMGL